MIEKKHRVEDALEAVSSAQQEGIIPGGSSALLRITKKIDIQAENRNSNLVLKLLKKLSKNHSGRWC